MSKSVAWICALIFLQCTQVLQIWSTYVSMPQFPFPDDRESKLQMEMITHMPQPNVHFQLVKPILIANKPTVSPDMNKPANSMMTTGNGFSTSQLIPKTVKPKPSGVGMNKPMATQNVMMGKPAEFTKPAVTSTAGTTMIMNPTMDKSPAMKPEPRFLFGNLGNTTTTSTGTGSATLSFVPAFSLFGKK